ncbi:MAG: DbpA RNA binding domain-containing protein [Gemmatimonadaceae bacterium]
MEHDDRELSGAARSAHVLHVTPRIGGESARVVQSALSKPAQGTDVANLVIVGDRQTAYELAGSTRRAGAVLTPLSVPTRATALLQRQPHSVVGAPSDLMALVRSAALKLESVRHVVLLWADAILANEQQATDLDTLLTETPREGDRTLIVEQVTPAVDAFIERGALKPRRLTHELALPAEQQRVSYLLVAAEQRAAMLQQLLDARDTSSVAVVADDASAVQDASDALAALGIEVPGTAHVVTAPEVADAALVVWYGVPNSPERITALLSGTDEASQIVILATPIELQRVRSLTNAITLVPENLPQPTDEAALRQRLLREELASLLRRESVDAELLALEPLFARHAAAEIAGAALRLLSRARQAAARAERAEAPVATRPSSAAAGGDQHWTRLFVSVGERDGARRGDLVGAITGEAGITGAQVGKIEMRDTYSLVDVATPVVDKVVERLTGVSIRGRRVTARLDRGGTRAGPADARRGPPRREGSDTVGARGAPRAAREHEEWSSRAERLRHARRPPASGSEP